MTTLTPKSPSIPPVHHHTLTLEQHVRQLERKHGVSDTLTALFAELSLAGKLIYSQVTRAGLAGVLGLTGDENVQGEEVQKLDIVANNLLIRCVQQGGQVCVMGSEEVEEPIAIPPEYPVGDYVLQFDPLDGSGNIDINASIGTIFSIHKRKSASGPGTLEDCLQPGKDIVAAGYIIYGSSCMFVYSAGFGVYGFTFDPAIGEFFLSHEKIRMPEQGDTYSVNEGNYHKWSPQMRQWADAIKTPTDARKAYRHRYIGAMVADLHRTMLRGGIFAYPSDKNNSRGKLRLLYEASPFAFLVEQAGGAASDGKTRILDVEPTELHQRTPFFAGSKHDVEELIRTLSS